MLGPKQFGCRRRMMHERFGFNVKVVGQKQTPHSVLGLSDSATKAEVKQAYRKLALQYHPDRGVQSDKNKEKFLEIQEAYDSITRPAPKPSSRRTTRSSTQQQQQYSGADYDERERARRAQYEQYKTGKFSISRTNFSSNF